MVLLRRSLGSADADQATWGPPAETAGPLDQVAPTGTWGGAPVGANNFDEVRLDEQRLESSRVIGHNVADPRSTSYDMLRTQVLQAMDQNGWQLIGVTSPTMGCGKTLSSINLALSMARQRERPVLLIDMDFRKPQIAARLGLKAQAGLLDVLEGRATIREAIFAARAGAHRVLVLSTRKVAASSEIIASRAMAAFLQDIRKEFPSHIVVLDLPPVLVSADVIALLPRIDCVLLVAAVGISTAAEVEESGRHLQGTNLVRIVVNKLPESGKRYY